MGLYDASTTFASIRVGLWACVLLLGAVVLLPAPAWAHGDARLAGATMTIPAGGSAAFQGNVHYHRLVGTVHADGPVRVSVSAAQTREPVLALGPARFLALNELVACCDDGPWTPHELTIHNPGVVPVVATAELALVHDDLAVMVFTAESGARESVIVLAAAWVALLWWAVRRRRTTPTLQPAAVGLAAVSGSVAALGLVGASRYETGGAPALLAALSDVPLFPMNPVVSRASLLVGLALLGWGWAGVRWASARPCAAPVRWRAVGTGLIAAVVATGVLVATAYGRGGMATASGLAAAVPVAVVLLIGTHRSAASVWHRR